MKVLSKFHEHQPTALKDQTEDTYAQYGDLISLLFFREEGKQATNWYTVLDLFVDLKKAYG